ncbi:MAG: DUF2914 domain-containing protein [Candidatus Tectomicrobia bacterium]|uniref:DUF2914 domain-containing protein n=1 Tax=Tectimicrobiota bacterium TaxID=2528274 RepID=A0A933LRV2_UNCTE|nr:DUF2914 domain-containing protein [Candidatus Tectomicrobia bacterium]
MELHTDSTANVPKETIPAPPAHQQRSVSPESMPEEPSSDKQALQQALLAPAEETNLLAIKKEEEGKEGLSITNLVFAKSIDNLLPSGEGTAFHFSIGRVYCWMDVENASPPTTLKHIYSFKDQKILEVELQIKYPHMRLWSYKTISENIFVGKWRVDITDNEGKILTTGYFDITE